MQQLWTNYELSEEQKESYVIHTYMPHRLKQLNEGMLKTQFHEQK